jgi:16S rRNA U516 pseudouridylate synthase RsuA-like enzyme
MARVPLIDLAMGNDDDEDDEIDEIKSTDNGIMKGNAGIVQGAQGEVDLENTKLVNTSRVVVSVTEGKYRMVRRVLHNAGHSVLQLHRVRYGSVSLGDLEGGEVRPCSPEEKNWAEQLGKNISAAKQQSMKVAKQEKRAKETITDGAV